MTEISIYDADGNQITSLVQWDTDVYIYINENNIEYAYDVHFFNSQSEYALVVNSEYSDGILKAKIPNSLLETNYTIFGYVYGEKDDGYRSIHCFKIAVRMCPKPSSYVYTDSEDYASVSIILQKCLVYAAEAEASSEQSGIYATLAQSYAVGGTGARDSEDTDNSKYYSDLAASYSEAASESENAVAVSAETVKASAEASALSAEEASASAEAAANSASSVYDVYEIVLNTAVGVEYDEDNESIDITSAIETMDTELSVIVDDATGAVYTIGIENGVLYIDDGED